MANTKKVSNSKKSTVKNKKVGNKNNVVSKSENKTVDISKKVIDNLGILIQLVLSILLIIFIVYSVFITEFYNLTVGLLTALSFTMAYNNHTTYKRKNFTIIYCVIGIAGLAFLIGTMF